MTKKKLPHELKPKGRPTKYTDEVAEIICNKIASGLTLRQACRDDDMPAPSTVVGWTGTIPAFFEQYTRARMVQLTLMADDMIEIADGVDEPDHGEYPRDHETKVRIRDPQRDRVRVQTRQFLLSKMLPRVWGPRAPQNDVPEAGDVTVNVVDISSQPVEKPDTIKQYEIDASGDLKEIEK